MALLLFKMISMVRMMAAAIATTTIGTKQLQHLPGLEFPTHEPLKNCSTYPEPNNCACDRTPINGDPGKGNCFACGSCKSCFGCHSCITCHDDGMPPSPQPTPPHPTPPPVPPPAAWAPRVAAAQLLVAESDPTEPGLFPSVGNGFISANVGCANTEFFVHVGGVFSNRLAIHASGSTSIPHRAGIPNPFTAVATIVDSNNLRAGTALDLQHGLFTNVTASAATDGTRVATTVYAHRALRNVLVFEVSADFAAASNATTVTVRLDRCDGGKHGMIDWSNLSDFTATSTGGGWSLRVKSMEENCDSGHFCPRAIPLANCSVAQGGRCNNTAMPQLPYTEVGITFEPLPRTLTLTSSQPTRKFIAAIHTSLEPGLSAPGAAATAAVATLVQFGNLSSASLRKSHEAAWAEEWEGGIEVAGNLTIASTINASLYYILSATRSDWPYGLSPGGLARDDYEGHSFWDCETWMFPNLVALYPQQARALAQYRFNRLPAARMRATTHGLRGAMWPWESALTGFGEYESNDDHEIHISGDVANGFRLYFRMTQNVSWLRNEGWPVVRDSADFFASRAVACDNVSCTLGASGVTTHNLTYLDVVAPDESAGRHDSSAYTNGIAVTVLDFALEVAALLGETPSANWSSVAERLYLPIVRVKAPGFMEGTPVHPEYQGYDQKKRPHINQADVALLQYPLGLRTNKRVFPSLLNSKNPDNQLAVNDLLFWQPKSDNQVFYTGDSAYSIAWLEMGNRTAADSQFDLAFTHMDLKHFNVFMEKNYGDGGNLNFITGAGGYLQNFVNGYAGLRYTKEGITLRPVVPPHAATSLKLRGLSLAGSRMDVYYDVAAITVTLNSGPGVTVKSHGAADTKLSHAGETATIKLCKTCGCGCLGGGCGCLAVVPTKERVATLTNQ